MHNLPMLLAEISDIPNEYNIKGEKKTIFNEG